MIYQMLPTLPSGRHYAALWKWEPLRVRRPFVTPQSPWQRGSAIQAGPWCLPQKLDRSNSIFFSSLCTVLPPLPFVFPRSLSSPVQATPKLLEICISQSLTFSHQNWDWNSNLASLYLFPFGLQSLPATVQMTVISPFLSLSRPSFPFSAF